MNITHLLLLVVGASGVCACSAPSERGTHSRLWMSALASARIEWAYTLPQIKEVDSDFDIPNGPFVVFTSTAKIHPSSWRGNSVNRRKFNEAIASLGAHPSTVAAFKKVTAASRPIQISDLQFKPVARPARADEQFHDGPTMLGGYEYDGYEFGVAAVSDIAFSEDGDQAMFFVATQVGPFSVDEKIVLFEHTDEGWVPVHSRPVLTTLFTTDHGPRAAQHALAADAAPQRR